jgi:chemotaxis receptor (MCP) glutamine deamidase CheD
MYKVINSKITDRNLNVSKEVLKEKNLNITIKTLTKNQSKNIKNHIQIRNVLAFKVMDKLKRSKDKNRVK